LAVLPLLKVIFLGFTCGLIPGPVVTAVFAETLRGGWRGARRIVLWAAAGECAMSVICVAALSAVPAASPIFSYLSLGGAAVLLWISINLWRIRAVDTSGDGTLFTDAQVFTFAVLNGMAWMFWITVCVPQAVALDSILPGGRWLFIAFFELGWLVATLSLCRLFGFFRAFFRDERKVHLLYRAIAVAFVLFALDRAWESGNALIH
jgi:threonine/homoserine/homoserine lactone efflux protein